MHLALICAALLASAPLAPSPARAEGAHAAVAEAGAEWGGIEIFGEPVAPGERRRVDLPTSETFAGFSLPTPVVVLRGERPGPALCLTGGIHGDELNGVEVVRRSLQEVDPAHLRGTLIGIPIANLHGFRRSSRYLPDRRDLNRHFPGRANGSVASRIAHRLFDGVILRCDALVDVHSGSFHRTNLPQVRADLRNPAVLELALGFRAPIVVHSLGTTGTLRRAAVDRGIPAITYEAGEPMQLDEEEVRLGVAGVHSLLAALVMTSPGSVIAPASQVFYRSHWVRADAGGILLSRVRLGELVSARQTLGVVTDPLSNDEFPIIAPHGGRVIGMAQNQVVIPGFAAYHVGLDGGDPPSGQPPAVAAEPEEPDDVDERPE